MSTRLNGKTALFQIGIDVDAALEALANKPISIHCWQGDDVGVLKTPIPRSRGIQSHG